MIEHEVKLSAWPGFTLPDLDGVTDGARTRRRETIDLDATYFDTPDLRLGRRGITLRHRQRGARGTWTVKLPTGDTPVAGGTSRDEIEVTATIGEVPAELALLVAAHVRTAPLVRVARLMTVRRRTVVDGPDGLPLAEVDDDEVSVMDGGRVAARFRELEVEIAPDAPPAVARAVVERLRRNGADPAGTLPKVARAVGPRFLDPPESAVAPLPDDPTASDVVTAAIRGSVGRILDHHAPAVLGTDPEGVHQMRVGARRLRSDLRTFGPLLDGDVTDRLREELRWLGRALGAVRDPDVLRDRVRAGLDRLDEADREAGAAVLAWLDTDRAAGVERLHRALGSDRYLELLDDLVELGEGPPLRPAADGPADRVLPGLVRDPWARLRKQVAALGREPADTDLHEVRKRAKQVRYAAEAVAPVVGKRARRAARGAKGLQTLLGDHQDAVVAEAWMRDLAVAGDLEPGAVFTLGGLVAGERIVRSECRARWPELWAKASAADRWAWLG
ncbi:MAG TPA: CYTH and CHAD domain-containing protein [Acidimicrobiales bacterium]|nr:CYTH and CHAD domain-containing protein [Acidimicrobiales bacterium]